jgi:23S rRNA (adenine2503-C2)-methyltransferase
MSDDLGRCPARFTISHFRRWRVSWFHLGVSAVHARALWRAVHREGSTELAARDDFSPPLRRWVKARVGGEDGFTAALPEVRTETASTDGLTRKYLLKLADGQDDRDGADGYPGRHTACVSTQVGCAMGCVFCATGQMGFARHLQPGEIVGQVLHCRRASCARRAAGSCATWC